MTVGEVRAILGADVGQFVAGFKSAATSVQALGPAADAAAARLKAAGERMTDVGRTLSTRLTLPLVAGGTAALKFSADFERSLQTVVGLVGIAQQDVGGFRAEILKLAPAVGKGPTELADALFFITSAGLRGAEALEALERSARASAAGLGETKSVALAVVSAVNTFRDQNLTASQATDVLVKTIREGNLEAGSLASALGRVLGTAQAAGASFSDVGAAIAVMTRQGVNAEEAVTALNAVFSLLLSTSGEAKDALKEVQLTIGGLRQELRERGLLAVLRTLDERLGGNVEALATVVPNVRALRSVLSILGQDAKTVSAVFESVRNATGATDEAFAAISQTLTQRFNQALATAQVALISLGDALKPAAIPALNAFADTVKSVTSAFQGLSPETRQAIVVIGLIAAAIGPLLLALGLLVKALAVAGAGLAAFIAVGGGIPALIAGGVIALGALAIALANVERGSGKSAAELKLLREEIEKAKAAPFSTKLASPEDLRALQDVRRELGEIDRRLKIIKEVRSPFTETTEVARLRSRRLELELAEARLGKRTEAGRIETPKMFEEPLLFPAAAMAPKEIARSKAVDDLIKKLQLEIDMQAGLSKALQSGLLAGEQFVAVQRALNEAFDAGIPAGSDEAKQIAALALQAFTATQGTREQEKALRELQSRRMAVADAFAEGADTAAADMRELERIRMLLDPLTAEQQTLADAMGFLNRQLSMGSDEAKRFAAEALPALQERFAATQTQANTLANGIRTELSASLGNAARDVAGLLVTFDSSKSAGDIFADTIGQITRRIIALAIEIKVIMPILDSLFGAKTAGGGRAGGGLFDKFVDFVGSFFARGGVFSSGRALAFQAGGIISQPTAFPIGIAGERGPEAILPLAKTRGGLGVSAEGIGGVVVNVQVINNAPNTRATARPGVNARDVVVVIDQLMAERVQQGGDTFRALRTTTGARRIPTARG